MLCGFLCENMCHTWTWVYAGHLACWPGQGTKCSVLARSSTHHTIRLPAHGILASVYLVLWHGTHTGFPEICKPWKTIKFKPVDKSVHWVEKLFALSNIPDPLSSYNDTQWTLVGRLRCGGGGRGAGGLQSTTKCRCTWLYCLAVCVCSNKGKNASGVILGISCTWAVWHRMYTHSLVYLHIPYIQLGWFIPSCEHSRSPTGKKKVIWAHGCVSMQNTTGLF